MIDQMKIGSFLRELRREKELTQEQLAERFGVSSRSVSRWENGNTLPDLGILVELADFYEVEVKEIIDGERKNGMTKLDAKEGFLKAAEYADHHEKQAVTRSVIFFGLELISFVIAVCAGYRAVHGSGQVAVWCAVIAIVLAVVFCGALIMTARHDVARLQRKGER